MNINEYYQLQMRAAWQDAFRELAGCEPTDEDLHELEQQHQNAWAQQIENESDLQRQEEK